MISLYQVKSNPPTPSRIFRTNQLIDNSRLFLGYSELASHRLPFMVRVNGGSDEGFLFKLTTRKVAKARFVVYKCGCHKKLVLDKICGEVRGEVSGHTCRKLSCRKSFYELKQSIQLNGSDDDIAAFTRATVVQCNHTGYTRVEQSYWNWSEDKVIVVLEKDRTLFRKYRLKKENVFSDKMTYLCETCLPEQSAEIVVYNTRIGVPVVFQPSVDAHSSGCNPKQYELLDQNDMNNFFQIDDMDVFQVVPKERWFRHEGNNYCVVDRLFIRSLTDQNLCHVYVKADCKNGYLCESCNDGPYYSYLVNNRVLASYLPHFKKCKPQSFVAAVKKQNERVVDIEGETFNFGYQPHGRRCGTTKRRTMICVEDDQPQVAKRRSRPAVGSPTPVQSRNACKTCSSFRGRRRWAISPNSASETGESSVSICGQLNESFDAVRSTANHSIVAGELVEPVSDDDIVFVDVVLNTEQKPDRGKLVSNDDSETGGSRSMSSQPTHDPPDVVDVTMNHSIEPDQPMLDLTEDVNVSFGAVDNIDYAPVSPNFFRQPEQEARLINTPKTEVTSDQDACSPSATNDFAFLFDVQKHAPEDVRNIYAEIKRIDLEAAKKLKFADGCDLIASLFKGSTFYMDGRQRIRERLDFNLLCHSNNNQDFREGMKCVEAMKSTGMHALHFGCLSRLLQCSVIFKNHVNDESSAFLVNHVSAPTLFFNLEKNGYSLHTIV